MQEIKKNPILLWESNRFTWFTSLVLLFLVLFAIIWLKTYDYMQSNTIEKMNADIVDLDTKLTLASADRQVIIANILKSSTIRPSLDLQKYVRSFRQAAAQAGVRLKWFSIANDTITSQLIATSESDGTDPVTTIISMMRIQNPKNELVLMPISSLAGNNRERTTGVSFHILPSNPTTNAAK